MTRLDPLPQIMLAPTGARRGKDDHPAIPLTIPEIVGAAQAAWDAGARALHAHVRDGDGVHVLDAGLYRELIGEMRRRVPDMPVQITTEAAGRFAPDAQMAVVRALRPEGVSIALRELWGDASDTAGTSRFYFWCAEAGIAVQHILYDLDDIRRLAELRAASAIPPPRQCLFVLGAYAPPRPGRPEHLGPLLAESQTHLGAMDWAVCAFGRQEIACALEAVRRGGKARIGFENNIETRDGRVLSDNSESVRALICALEAGAVR